MSGTFAHCCTRLVLSLPPTMCWADVVMAIQTVLWDSLFFIHSLCAKNFFKSCVMQQRLSIPHTHTGWYRLHFLHCKVLKLLLWLCHWLEQFAHSSTQASFCHDSPPLHLTFSNWSIWCLAAISLPAGGANSPQPGDAAGLQHQSSVGCNSVKKEHSNVHRNLPRGRLFQKARLFHQMNHFSFSSDIVHLSQNNIPPIGLPVCKKLVFHIKVRHVTWLPFFWKEQKLKNILILCRSEGHSFERFLWCIINWVYYNKRMIPKVWFSVFVGYQYMIPYTVGWLS